jgi:hypothetical protein
MVMMQVVRHRRVIAAAVIVSLVALGFVFGVAVNRVQAGRARPSVLTQDEDALRQRNRQFMAIELRTHGHHQAFQREWQQRLERIDEAVVLGDTKTAVAVWREAYAASMRSGHWRDLIDVGDAAILIGDVQDFPETAAGAARRSFLTALYRAKAQRSVEGVLRAAEGFASLGDGAAVQNCVAIANRVADTDAASRAQVQAFTERFAATRVDRSTTSGSSGG